MKQNAKRRVDKGAHMVGQRLGFSVRIFIPNGEPEGLRIIEKSNWTGQGLSFPRAIYSEVRGRQELRRSGVYVLWSPNGLEQLPRAYIGQGDALLGRLDSHERNKDFWTQAVVFGSKDQNLNKAHIQYLEACLVGLATEAKRCEIDNANVPQIPSLSDADAADAELYLADMLLCLPIVGVTFFERPRTQEEKRQDLVLKGKNIVARGYEGAGGFVVQSGSQAVKEEVSSIQAYLSNLRKTLISKGLLQDDGAVYRLIQDYAFDSPSAASGVLLGRSSNGLNDWKDGNGRSLKQIRESAVELP